MIRKCLIFFQKMKFSKNGFLRNGENKYRLYNIVKINSSLIIIFKITIHLLTLIYTNVEYGAVGPRLGFKKHYQFLSIKSALYITSHLYHRFLELRNYLFVYSFIHLFIYYFIYLLTNFLFFKYKKDLPGIILCARA